MYQAIFYDYDTYSYKMRDDEHGWLDFKYQPTYYRLDPKGDIPTLDGLRAVAHKKRIQQGDGGIYYERDVDKLTRVLVDQYYESDEPAKWQNLLFLDIEIEILGALTPQNIRAANAEITSLAMYDQTTNRKYCLIVDEEGNLDPYEADGKFVIPCTSERDLAVKFLDLWEELDPTIVVTWNGRYFDIPYLYFRLSRILSKFQADRLSPIGKVRVTNSFSWNGEGEAEDLANAADIVDLGGINHLDYMLLFKKYIVKQEPSYKLGDIGEKYVKLGKIEYEGNLDRLFKDDPLKFIEYNIRDIDIIIELEKKLAFIELTTILCHLCHTTYESVYFSTAMNDGAILTYLKRKGIASPNKPTTTNPGLRAKNKDPYAGGYLKEPIPGLYEWIIDLDFTSLYPSIIRSLNIGLETFVGRILNDDIFDDNWTLKDLKAMDPNELITIEKLDEYRNIIQNQVPVKTVIAFIEDSNITIGANGGLFRNDKSSVVCDILEDWMLKRSEYKGLMNASYKAGDKEKGDFYNRRQHAYKIKLNDVYGSYAINSWRYTDGNKMISASITLTGQRLTKESIKFVNKWVNEKLGTKGVDHVVTSDTDSLFIVLKDILIHQEVDLNDKEASIKAVLELATEIQTATNEYLNIIAKELYNIQGKHYFQLKQEVVVERGYFAKKRRYAMYVVNKEGVDVEKLEIVGMDLMKSNMPVTYKKFGEDVLKDIIFGKGESAVNKKIMDFKQSISNLDWRLLAKPTGVKNIRKYTASAPKNGEIFSELRSRCPINVRSAINYNDLIKFKKVDDKFPIFTEGDKIRFIGLKNNPYYIKTLAFTENDPDFITEFIEEYKDIDGGFETVLLNKLTGIYEDIGWAFPSLNKRVGKFFKF